MYKSLFIKCYEKAILLTNILKINCKDFNFFQAKKFQKKITIQLSNKQEFLKKNRISAFFSSGGHKIIQVKYK